MFTEWIPVDDIPAEGRVFSFADTGKWSDAFGECRLELSIPDGETLSAEVFILPQEEGCLLRGTIRGPLATACDRCVERAVFEMDCSFEEFEPFPGDGDDEDGEDEERIDMPLFRRDAGEWELNLGAVVWEQFSLDLPGRCLCSPVCKGLCASCGANLNKGNCSCEQDEGDPRLAPLRNLKLKR